MNITTQFLLHSLPFLSCLSPHLLAPFPFVKDLSLFPIQTEQTSDLQKELTDLHQMLAF